MKACENARRVNPGFNVGVAEVNPLTRALGTIQDMKLTASPSHTERMKAKAAFIRQLAAFLTDDQLRRGELALYGNGRSEVQQLAREWDRLRSLAPLSRHAKRAEAERILKEFLT